MLHTDVILELDPLFLREERAEQGVTKGYSLHAGKGSKL